MVLISVTCMSIIHKKISAMCKGSTIIAISRVCKYLKTAQHSTRKERRVTSCQRDRSI